jgi:nucleoside-diphosphate-sugar epimerase
MCGDGTNTEATTYIDNLTEAIIGAISSRAAPGRVYLIHDSFRIPWKTFISRQLEAAGILPRFFRVPRMLAIPAAWTLDHAASLLRLPVPLALFGVRSAMTSRHFVGTRAQDELGYTNQIDLEAGLLNLRKWVTEIGGPVALARGAKRK